MKKSLRAKMFALILLFSLTLSAISVVVSYAVHESTTNDQYKTTTVNLTKTEALMVDGDQLDLYGKRVRAIYEAYAEEHGAVPDMEAMTEEEQEAYLALYSEVYDMPGYADMVARLQDLLRANDVLYLYINLWDVENGTVIYLMDGSIDDSTPIGWIEYIEEENLEKIRRGDYDIPAFITTYPEYGWLCTATSLIHDSEGNIVAHAYADISMNAEKEKDYQFLINIGLLVLVLTLVLMPVILFIFNRLMVRPIKLISETAGNFVSDRDQSQQNIFSSVNINRQDEIGTLYDSMTKMEKEINDYIKNITDITAEKERVGAELHVATQIQADMLPSVFPAFPDRHEFDIYASMTPAKEVGGDFYDFFLIDDDHMAMVMADVSGKGVPAALFMAIAKTLIKRRAQAGGSPSEILADANNMLCEGNHAQLFVTVWIGILTLSTGKGVAANAGHEDPVIRRAGGDFELIKYRHSPAVAAMEGIPFRQHEFELFPGDTLFVYTDGVPEATNDRNELYGTARMLDALNRNKGEKLSVLLQKVHEDVNRFVGTAPQFDDITMLGFDYYGKEGKKQ